MNIEFNSALSERAITHKSGFITPPISLFRGLPFVLLFASFGEANLNFSNAAIIKIQLKRYEGHSFTPD